MQFYFIAVCVSPNIHVSASSLHVYEPMWYASHRSPQKPIDDTLSNTILNSCNYSIWLCNLVFHSLLCKFKRCYFLKSQNIYIKIVFTLTMVSWGHWNIWFLSRGTWHSHCYTEMLGWKLTVIHWLHIC